MNDSPVEQTQAAPIAEAQNTATETTHNTPAIVEPTSTDAEGQQANADEKANDKTAEQKEVERLRRALTKRDRTQGKLYQEVQTLREQLERHAPATEAPPAAPTDPHQIAKEIVALEKVTERANGVASDGQKRFPEFNQALQTLRAEAGDLFDRRGMPTPLGEAILESDDAAALIHHLGTHPELVDEFEGLSPAALGRKVARIEAQMASAPAPKPVSKASEPIAPIRGTAGATVKTPDQMTVEEYATWRKSQGARWAR